MTVGELTAILRSYPCDFRVVVRCNVGYSDVVVAESATATNHNLTACQRRRTSGVPSPLTYGVHAAPDRIFEEIKATETAILIGLDTR